MKYEQYFVTCDWGNASEITAELASVKAVFFNLSAKLNC